MDRWKCLVITILLTVLYGCATPLAPNQVAVCFETIPTGALLYGGNGEAWGQAPKTRVFTLAERGTGTARVTAVWPSGAKITDSVIMNTYTREMTKTLSRPMNAPGLDRDLPQDRGNDSPMVVCTKIGTSVICQ